MSAGKRRYLKNLNFSIANQVVLGLAGALLGLASVFYFTLADTKLPYYNSDELRIVQLSNSITDSLNVGLDLQSSLLLSHQLVLRTTTTEIVRIKTSLAKFRTNVPSAVYLNNVLVIHSDPALWRVLNPQQSQQQRLPQKPNEIALSFDLAEKLFGNTQSAIGKTVMVAAKPYSVVHVTNQKFVPPVQFANIVRDSRAYFALIAENFSGEHQQLLNDDRAGQLLLLLRSKNSDDDIKQELYAVISQLIDKKQTANIAIKPLVNHMKGEHQSIAFLLIIAALVLAISVLVGASISYYSSANSRRREHFIMVSMGVSGQKRFLIEDIDIILQILVASVLAIAIIFVGGWFIVDMLSLNVRARWDLYVLAILISLLYLGFSLFVLIMQSRMALRWRNVAHNRNVKHGQLNKHTRFIQRISLVLIIFVGLITATISQGFLQSGIEAYAATKNKDYSDIYNLHLVFDGRISRGKIIGELDLLKQKLSDLPEITAVAFSQADPIDFRGTAYGYTGARYFDASSTVEYDQFGQKFYRTTNYEGSEPDDVKYTIIHVGVDRDLFRILQIPILDGKLWAENDSKKILLTKLSLVAIHGREDVTYDQAIPAGPLADENEYRAWGSDLQATGIVSNPRIKAPGFINNFGTYPLTFGQWNGPRRTDIDANANWELHAVLKVSKGKALPRPIIDEILNSLSIHVPTSKVTSLAIEVDKRVRQHKINALGVLVLVTGILLSIGLAAFGMLRFIYQASQNEIGTRLALGMTDRKLVIMLLYSELWPTITLVTIWVFLLGLAKVIAGVLGITGVPGAGSGLISASLVLIAVGMAFVLAIKDPLNQPPSYLMRLE